MADSFMNWAREAKNKKYVAAIILLIAISILLTFDPWGKKDGNKAQTVVKSESSKIAQESSYEEKLEKKLAVILSRMEGAGKVEVMVTTGGTEEKVIAHNINLSEQKTEEKDQSGGTRVTTQSQNKTDVVLQSGNIPYVTKENAPDIKGVFILAEGADDSEVKAKIIDAVSKLLDVPVHKISVEKKKN